MVCNRSRLDRHIDPIRLSDKARQSASMLTSSYKTTPLKTWQNYIQIYFQHLLAYSTIFKMSMFSRTKFFDFMQFLTGTRKKKLPRI